MTRTTPERSNPSALAITATALILAACTPTTRVVAVAGDRTVTFLDRNLQPRSSLHAEVPALPDAAVVDLRVSGDGTHLTLLLHEKTGGWLVQARRTDAAPMRRISLGDTDPERLLPFRDGIRFVTLSTRVTAESISAVAHLVSLSRRSAAARAFEVCAGRAAAGIVYEETDRVFVICDDDHITEIDATLQRIVRRVRIEEADDASSCRPRGAALTGGSGALLLSCRMRAQLVLVDRVTLTPFDSISLPTPGDLIVALTGHEVLVTHENGTVTTVDLRRRRALETVTLGGVLRQLVPGSERSVAFGLLQVESDRTMVARLVEGAVEARQPAPRGTRALAVWPSILPPVPVWIAPTARPDEKP